MSSVNSTGRRRILLLARGGAFNGSQRQVCYLARNLDPARYELAAILDRPGHLADALVGEGIDTRIMSLPHWRSFPQNLFRGFHARKIAGFARRRQVELVHAANFALSGYMHQVGRLLKTPTLLHIRGPLTPYEIDKHGVARADAVAAIAQRYRDDLVAAGVNPSQISVIDDAVDLDLFRPQPDGKRHLRERFSLRGDVVVGLVGRVDAFKRVIEFLEAIAPLARQDKCRASFIIVGRRAEGVYDQAVSAAVERLGLCGRVTFLGQCDDMPAILNGVDILMTLSGGSVMFEAMACAKTVLSVRTDSRHSTHTRHGETAWCVTTDRPEPATAALESLIEDAALRNRLGQAACAWVRQHLSPAIMAQRTKELYDRMLER